MIKFIAAFAVVLATFAVEPSHLVAQSVTVDGEIRLSGQTLFRWHEGQTQMSLAEGNCRLEFNGKAYLANKVLVVTDGPRGNVRNRLAIEGLGGTKKSATEPSQPLVVTLRSDDEPRVQSDQYRAKPASRPFLLDYLEQSLARQAATSEVAQTQFVQGGQTQSIPVPEPIPDDNVNTRQWEVPNPPLSRLPTELTGPNTFNGPSTSGGFGDSYPIDQYSVADPLEPTNNSEFLFGGGTKGVQIGPRHPSSPPRVDMTLVPETNETVVIGRGGVVITIRDVSTQFPDGRVMDFGTVTISANRVVGWVPNMVDVINGDASFNSADGELYLEGDIVFRAGDSLIYAESMYYNVVKETGMVLDAEAITTIPEYQGVVRLKAEVLQQISHGNFRAFDAAVTSSRLGVPRYWLQSETLEFYEKTRSVVDRDSGLLVSDNDPFVRSKNSFVFVGGIPIFYWPRFATSLERPVFYIQGIKVRNDQNFGSQILLDWDIFQLLGIDNIPEGVDWQLSTDYLSKRGPALGTTFKYDVPAFFGLMGHTRGNLDVWGIDDSGLDQLGRGRMDLPLEETTRGRVKWQHRQKLANDWEVTGQVGYLSDRNFLEQYLEYEWDQNPDHVTELRVQKYYHNQLFELSATPQLNTFFQKTERLPEFNHYLFGSSILNDRLTWQMHNHASYSKLNQADDPLDPVQAANYFPLPGEMDREGVIASTRQELAMNLDFGPFNIRPIASIEASHYGEAADGDSLTRLLGQSGVQVNLPMVRVDPTIQSTLLNMRGLAHKMEWKAEYWYADSNTDLDELPFYDALDDDPQEQFRRRFIGSTFNGSLPTAFDPRNYAYRQGVQRWLASPSEVVADDLQQIRLGLNQRFQTKRGLPGQDRIVDIIQFDVETILFPREDRDNFGETLGPTTYDFRYHIGDRLSLVSDGYLDFFDEGLRSLSAGVRSSRPGVSDWYVGMMSLEGPISSTVFRSNFDYRVNEKWIVSGGTTYDFGSTGYVGQNFGITRIGESMLVRLNIAADRGRDNVSFGFVIEPRFFPRLLGNVGGGMIPPPGIEGLE
ncbi:LPS assembly protein LptD [Rhodopirellula sp. MGV]|uniref:LPS assembly protein LptD n=1 Tax=Rhodopirellula sp. MGV TaxID=2023130 RepID=UPI00117ADF3A|nr:LPS assembly protein LptD [Rhodopirellula sp. MGV]